MTDHLVPTRMLHPSTAHRGSSLVLLGHATVRRS